MPEDMSRAIRMPDGSYKCEPCQIEEILCLFAKHANDKFVNSISLPNDRLMYLKNSVCIW